MLRSMTGFAQKKVKTPFGALLIEIKTLNNRYLDISINTPRELSAEENVLRDIVKEHIKRGKVTILIRWEQDPAVMMAPKLNYRLLKELFREIEAIPRKTGLKTPLNLDLQPILQLPGVMEYAAAEVDEKKIHPLLEKALQSALKEVVRMRAREAQSLKVEIVTQLEKLKKQQRELMNLKSEFVRAYREKFEKRIEEWTKDFGVKLDDARMQQEVLYYVDRSDTTEELVRLKTHMQHFQKKLDARHTDAKGKVLDFIIQEMFREINTIASKFRVARAGKLAVEMKNEVEKIREQVQNIE